MKEEEIMNFDDKLGFMDFLHESIIQHLQDCDSSELNSLLSNYVEVVMNLSMDLCKHSHEDLSTWSNND